MSKAIIHHPGHTAEEADDWYDRFFASPNPGDWLWRTTNIDGRTYRTILMVVPLVPPDYRVCGKVANRGGELLRVFVNRGKDNWNEPGPIDAWDHNEESPTLNPSIFCRGKSDVPGWHGFFQNGQLVNLDGSIVGETQ